jgi:hypothetical protein
MVTGELRPAKNANVRVADGLVAISLHINQARKYAKALLYTGITQRNRNCYYYHYFTTNTSTTTATATTRKIQKII